MPADYSDEFIQWARAQRKSKRAEAVLDFMLEHGGSVTTGDLARLGYEHPPRAVMDLRDAGFAYVSAPDRVDGVRMQRYTLIDTMTEGYAHRQPIPAAFRETLFSEHGYHCAVCGGQFISRMLQADHRVPFYIGGDPRPFVTDAFMPLCGSDNRAKSMSCENCPNWTVRDPRVCTSCYWHDPEDYTHVATLEERRLSVVVRGADVNVYDKLAERAADENVSVVELVMRKFIEDYGIRD